MGLAFYGLAGVVSEAAGVLTLKRVKVPYSKVTCPPIAKRGKLPPRIQGRLGGGLQTVIFAGR